MKYENIELKILSPEYLIAIYLRIFRKKDIPKVSKLIGQAKINKNLLMKILKKYGLKKRYEDFIKKYYE